MARVTDRQNAQMAMAVAAMARSPTLTTKPPLTPSLPQRHFGQGGFQKPFLSPTRRFSASSTVAKLGQVTKQWQGEAATAMGAALIGALSSCDSASAAQEVMELAANDNRGTLLLLPLVPAIAWVLYNILQPALNQINRMRGAKGLVACAGLGAAGGAAFLSTPEEAHAEQLVFDLAAQAANNDNRGLLLLIVVLPAIAWVLYNILQPALNQINRMRSG